jgi:DmsE family decaheme c-type cytochrome
MLLVWLGVAGAQPTAPQKAATVGSQACQVCHEDVYKAFQKNPHAGVDKDAKRGWEGKACESCHGPGSLHAEAGDKNGIRNPAKISTGEADKACLGCHLNQPTHAGRIQGAHAKNQVGCASCHPVHKPASGEMVARSATAVNKLCAGCHQPVWAEFQKPYKHKLPEGAMSCVDCHNPHGSILPSSIRTASSNDPSCLKCHGDKRGPFVYEHAGVRLEGCKSCHQPHGSANPRMLARHEVRFVCLECHANLPAVGAQAQGARVGVVPPALHDLRSQRYQNCTICHVKVHGSNVDKALMR